MKLRPATPADVELLRRWDEQPHVVASDPNDDWAWETELGRLPDWREQLIAETDGRPVGFVQIIDPEREESHYWGDVPANLRAIDLWIGSAADLGKGYGTRMMELALARCFGAPSVSAVLVDPLASNNRAHRFYERLAFRFIERRRFGADECLVYRLDRSEYVRAVRAGSPATVQAATNDLFTLKPIGRISSSLVDREHAPKQGFEGAPEAWLVFKPAFADGLRDLKEGEEILVLTWLDRGDRETLRVHPRDDRSAPLRGVFSTRSQDRPNPVGIHRVSIVAIASPTRFKVRHLEAFDGTPIIDVKPVLDRVTER
jgi:aminoglycoside 6'-N-acetyltransferase